MSTGHPPKIGYIGQDPETYRILRLDTRFEVVFAARIAWLERPFGGWADRLLAGIYRRRVRGAFPQRWRVTLSLLLLALRPYLRPHGRRYLWLVRDAVRSAVPLIDPETPEGMAQMRAAGAELAVVSWWGLLPPAVLILFPKGLVNVHPSRLPKYRGALPTLWTLKNGDRHSAVSFLKIDEGTDTGPLLDVIDFEVVAEDNWKSLEDKVVSIVAGHLPRVLASYLAGTLKPRPQEECEASVTGHYRLCQELRPRCETAGEARNKIGLYPWFDPHEACHFSSPQGPVPVTGCEEAAGCGPPGSATVRGAWLTVNFLDGALRFRIGRHLSAKAVQRLRRMGPPLAPLDQNSSSLPNNLLKKSANRIGQLRSGQNGVRPSSASGGNGVMDP